MVPTKVVFGFICKYADGEPRASEENSDSRWVKKDKVLDMITDPSIRDRFQSYLDFNGSVQYMEYITKPKYKLKLKYHI